MMCLFSRSPGLGTRLPHLLLSRCVYSIHTPHSHTHTHLPLSTSSLPIKLLDHAWPWPLERKRLFFSLVEEIRAAFRAVTSLSLLCSPPPPRPVRGSLSPFFRGTQAPVPSLWHSSWWCLFPMSVGGEEFPGGSGPGAMPYSPCSGSPSTR